MSRLLYGCANENFSVRSKYALTEGFCEEAADFDRTEASLEGLCLGTDVAVPQTAIAG